MDKMPQKKSNPPTRKSEKKTKAIALSAATCVLLGIIGYEVVKEQEDKKTAFSPIQEFTIPPLEAENEQLQIELNHSLQKLNELKRLLFVRNHAPENKALAELKEKILQKEEAVASLQKQLNDQQAALEQERVRGQSLEISLQALAEKINQETGSQDKISQQVESRLENHYQSLLQQSAQEQAEIADSHLIESTLHKLDSAKNQQERSSEIQALKEELALSKAREEQALFFKSQTEEKLSTLISKNNEIEALLSEKISELDVAKSEAEKFYNEVATQKAAIEDEAAIINALTQISRDATIENPLAQELASLQEELKALKAKEQQYTEEAEEEQKKKEGKEEEWKQIRYAFLEERKALIDELNALKQLLEEESLRTNNHQQHLEALKQERDFSSLLLADLESEVLKKEKLLEEQGQNHQAVKEELTNECTELQSRLEESQKEMDALKTEMETLLSNYETASHTITELRHEIETNNADHLNTHGELSASLEACKKELESLQGAYDKLQNSTSSSSSDLTHYENLLQEEITKHTALKDELSESLANQAKSLQQTESLHTQLREEIAKKEELEAVIASLQNVIQEKDLDIDQTRKSLTASLSEKEEALYAQLASETEAKRALEAEIASLKDEFEDAKRNLASSLSEKEEALHAQLASEAEAKRALEAEIASLKNEFEDAKRNLASSLSEKEEALHAQLTSESEAKRALEAEIASMKSDLQEKEELAAALFAKEQEIDSLKANYKEFGTDGALQEELEQTRKALEEKEEALSRSLEEQRKLEESSKSLSEIENRVAELEQLIRQKEAEFSAKSDESAKLLHEKETALNDLESHRQSLESNLSHLQDHYQSSSEELGALKDRLLHANNEQKNLQQQLAALEETIKTHPEEKMKLEEQLKEAQDSHEENRKRIEQLEHELQDKENEEEKLRSELSNQTQSLKSEIDQLKDQIAQEKRVAEQAATELKLMREEHQDALKKIAILETRPSEPRDLNAEASQRIRQLEKENQALKGKFQVLTSYLDEQKRQLKTLEGQRDQLAEEVTKKKSSSEAR